MKNNLIESGLGIITVIIGIVFLFQFIQVNKSTTSQNSYFLKAKFLKAGGIVVGNDVKIRGVKVGVVTNVSLDNELLAEVSFKIYSPVKSHLIAQYRFQVMGFWEINTCLYYQGQTQNKMKNNF